MNDSVIVPTNPPDDSGDLEVAALSSMAKEATAGLRRVRIADAIASMFGGLTIPDEMPPIANVMPSWIPSEWSEPIRIYGWIYCGFDAELFYSSLSMTCRSLYGRNLNDDLDYGDRSAWDKYGQGDRRAARFVTEFRRRVDASRANP